jgi:hypothetical protein
MPKKIIYPSMLLLAQTAIGNTITQIPEGKPIDYPCIHPDITPGAGPRVIDGVDLFVTAEYLYWIAQEDNLQFASTGQASLSDSSVTVNSGMTKHPNFHYRSGFKTTLGWNFGHDVWDTQLTYTWMQNNHNTASLTGSPTNEVTPAFTPVIELTSDDYFTSAKSRWGIHFNALDWELGRNSYLSKDLSLRPFLGLKASLQKQKFRNRYEGLRGDLHPTEFSYTNNQRMKFWGTGIRSGMNSSWHLSNSWSLYGDFALSALWGTFHTQRKDKNKISESKTKNVSVNQEYHCNAVSPVLELALGLRKDEWFFEDRVHISAQVGWEEQVWWNQNQFTVDRSIPRGGNLYLQGLTAKLRLDF